LRLKPGFPCNEFNLYRIKGQIGSVDEDGRHCSIVGVILGGPNGRIHDLHLLGVTLRNGKFTPKRHKPVTHHTNTFTLKHFEAL
jgi:hypothetical protein